MDNVFEKYESYITGLSGQAKEVALDAIALMASINIAQKTLEAIIASGRPDNFVVIKNALTNGMELLISKYKLEELDNEIRKHAKAID